MRADFAFPSAAAFADGSIVVGEYWRKHDAKAEAGEPRRYVWNKGGMFSVGLQDVEADVDFSGPKWIREEDYEARPAEDGLREARGD